MIPILTINWQESNIKNTALTAQTINPMVRYCH